METQHISTHVSHYIDHCRFQKGLSPQTLKAYQIDLNQFIAFVPVSDNGYTKENVQAYIAYLHSKYKVKSVKRKIATLKAFFSYLEFEELIDRNPFRKMQIRLHEPFLLPRTIPLSSIDAILQCAYHQKSLPKNSLYQYRSAQRDIAVLELLFASGMRVSELCSLQPSSVDLANGTIKIYGKGAKERIIQIGNTAVLAALSAYYQAFSEEITKSGWFFTNRLGAQLSDQSVRLLIQKYTTIAGIEQHITPHMFRHSFATLLLEEDVDIRYIQQLLGHSSITTTQIYTHVTSRKQRDILTTKHPRNKICI